MNERASYLVNRHVMASDQTRNLQPGQTGITPCRESTRKRGRSRVLVSVPLALCAAAEGLPAWGGYLPGHAEVGDAAAFPEVFGAVGGQAAGAAVAVEAAQGFVPVRGAGGVIAVGAVAFGDRRRELWLGIICANSL